MSTFHLSIAATVVTILCPQFFNNAHALPEEIPRHPDSGITKVRLLIQQAESLMEAGLLDSAAVIGNLALEKAGTEYGESDTTMANSLNVLGEICHDQANYAEAESLHRRALAIRERTLGTEHPDVAQSLNGLAILNRSQGKYSDAELLYNRALEIRKKALGVEHTKVAESQHGLAFVYWNQGRYTEAESLYKRALETREKVLGPGHSSVASSLNNLAVLYWDQGRYAEAESINIRALQIKKQTLGPDHPEVGQSLNNLAILYWNQGRYAEAEPLYGQSLMIKEKALGPEHPTVAKSVKNLAILYEDQGRYDEAEQLFERALAIKEKALGPEHPDVAHSLNDLAGLYNEQGRYAEAEPFHRRALSIKEKALGPGHPTVAFSLNDLARFYSDQGRYTEADSLYSRALAIREESLGDEHPDVAQSLNDLAHLFRRQGKYIEAEPLYKRALAIREKALGPDHPEVAQTLSELTKNYCDLDKSAQAFQSYDRLQISRKNFIESVFCYASEGQKMRYIEKYPLIDHIFFSFVILTNDDESKLAALEMILNSKAVVIDALSAEKEVVHGSYDKEIFEKLERHEQVSGEIATLSLAGAGRLKHDIYRDRLSQLYSTKDSLETDLSRSRVRFRAKLLPERFTISDIVSALPGNSVLWEFVRYSPFDFSETGIDKERTGSPRYLVFGLDRNGNVTMVDLGDAAEIDSLVGLARQQIYEARGVVYTSYAAESEKDLAVVTRALYEKVFSPLESGLRPGDNILISPDGQFNLLPFEILSAPDGEYVIEKYGISYLSSGRDLLRFRKDSDRSDWALVMADPAFDLSGDILSRRTGERKSQSGEITLLNIPDRGVSECLRKRFLPLPFTRKEIMFAASALQNKAHLETKSLYGEEALEEYLKGMTGSPRVLHLATHGYFCEDLDPEHGRILENPLLRSGLVLAGANRLMDEIQDGIEQGEDGILTALEVSGLNLTETELAILSACETGVGEIRNGEGVYGLRRAFQHAGTESILMSLWKVPDQETSLLMENFYDIWLDGHTKRDALRRSVLKILTDLRNRYGVAHPLRWGGFILAGNPN
jgi:tetratricopeptide (TPR) repeat protein